MPFDSSFWRRVEFRRSSQRFRHTVFRQQQPSRHCRDRVSSAGRPPVPPPSPATIAGRASSWLTSSAAAVCAPSPVTSGRLGHQLAGERAHGGAGAVDDIVVRRRAARRRRARVRPRRFQAGWETAAAPWRPPPSRGSPAAAACAASKPISEPPGFTPMAASTASGVLMHQAVDPDVLRRHADDARELARKLAPRAAVIVEMAAQRSRRGQWREPGTAPRRPRREAPAQAVALRQDTGSAPCGGDLGGAVVHRLSDASLTIHVTRSSITVAGMGGEFRHQRCAGHARLGVDFEQDQSSSSRARRVVVAEIGAARRPGSPAPGGPSMA